MTMSAVYNGSNLDSIVGEDPGIPFALLDEESKREIRRALLHAVCVPGYQVPFGSREMPVARGWGSGGLQITLAIVGKTDIVKVIDLNWYRRVIRGRGINNHPEPSQNS
jgi:alpha-D-ribose 1-methylphosphonate 5-phosphate C-P lyase